MLVTEASYRLITKDLTTASDTVTAAIEEAQSLLNEALDRYLESDEYTETLPLTQHSRIWPHGVPVTAVSGSSDVDGEIELGGWTVRVTSSTPATPASLFDLEPRGLYHDELSRTVSVTYTGGYSSSTLPAGLKRAIARLAYGLVNTKAGGGGPRVQVTSRSLGDASESYATGEAIPAGADAIIEETVPGLLLTVTGYRRPS